MDQDLELKAMSIVYETLKVMDQEAQIRVLSWVKSRLSLPYSSSQNPADIGTTSTPQGHAAPTTISAFTTAAEVLAQAQPERDAEKVLVVSAFIQEKLAKADLSGREIQAELHNLGFRVSNITTTIGRLIDRKPQLMIQTRKEGKSQQAQKKYRVTVAGINAVKDMLSTYTEV